MATEIPLQKLGLLDVIAKVSYGSWEFSGVARHQLSMDFVADPSNRSTMYTDVTLQIQDTLVAVDGTSIDEAILAAKSTLKRKKLKLSIEDAAVGKWVIGTNGEDGVTHPEMSNGPHPAGLRITRIAGKSAAAISLSIRFRVQGCFTFDSTTEDGQPVFGNRLLGIGYSVSHSVDDSGLVTRLISGTAIFPAGGLTTDGNGEIVPDGGFAWPEDWRKSPNAGDLWKRRLNEIFKPLPDFERRVSTTFSPDRTQLQFSITDSERSTTWGWPNRVVRFDGSHSVSGNVWGAEWECNLSVSFRIFKREGKAIAWSIFENIMRQKGIGDGLATNDGLRLIKRLSISTSLSDMNVSISISYRITTRFDKILEKSAIWKSLDYSWQQWADSVADARKPDGISGLVWRPQDEALVDLCLDDATSKPYYVETTASPTVTDELAYFGDQSAKLTPETSWVKHDLRIVASDTSRRAVVIDIAAPESSGGRGDDDLDSGTLSPTNISVARLHDPTGEAKPAIVQRLNSSAKRLFLIGAAERVKYPIPVPELKSIEGKQVVLVKRHMIARGKRGQTESGMDIHTLKWMIEYQTTEAIATIPLPPAHLTPATTGTSLEENDIGLEAATVEEES